MGGQRRYKTGMFDHAYRVVLEDPAGGKDTLLHGGDDFPEARAAFARCAAEHPHGSVLLMQRTRIVQRAGPNNDTAPTA